MTRKYTVFPVRQPLSNLLDATCNPEGIIAIELAADTRSNLLREIVELVKENGYSYVETVKLGDDAPTKNRHGVMFQGIPVIVRKGIMPLNRVIIHRAGSTLENPVIEDWEL